jgi:hypothetical protein
LQDEDVRWLRWTIGLSLASALVATLWHWLPGADHANALLVAGLTVLVCAAHGQAALDHRRELERLAHIGEYGWGLDPEFVARKLEVIRELRETSPLAHLRR